LDDPTFVDIDLEHLFLTASDKELIGTFGSKAQAAKISHVLMAMVGSVLVGGLNKPMSIAP